MVPKRDFLKKLLHLYFSKKTYIFEKLLITFCQILCAYLKRFEKPAPCSGCRGSTPATRPRRTAGSSPPGSGYMAPAMTADEIIEDDRERDAEGVAAGRRWR